MGQITEAELFDICYMAYEDNPKWDLLFSGEKDDDTYVGIKRIDDLDVVVFRGSVTAEDWLRNFTAFMVHDPKLGWIVDGFHISMPEVLANLKSVLGPKYMVLGHSRGAGMATIFAAEMTADENPPLLLMPLAPPRTGRSDLKQILSKVPTKALGNRGDPVVAVPPYAYHPYDVISIDAPPPEHDPWGPVAPHHSELYGKWIKAQDPMPVWKW